MSLATIRQIYGITSRPNRNRDVSIFGLCHFRKIQSRWNEGWYCLSESYRFPFFVWMDDQGITIGNLWFFRDQCIRLDFQVGGWSTDKNGIQIESSDRKSRLVLSDYRLMQEIKKKTNFQNVALNSITQTSATVW